ncbi:MAG TPA: hypothetical protein VEW67_08455 [Thermoleophilaceae bacterium]|nr:hypothetical protein [Thermoleophilaceae bacterium]
MTNGLVLIALGVGLFWAAPASLDVTRQTNRALADRARADDASSPVQWWHRMNARHGASGTALFGRLIGVGAIFVGLGLIVSDLR